jgi:GNAT superfamily N-acetyltransferase
VGGIENVVIASAYQRQGIGDALLAYAFDLAARQGCYKA